MFGGDISTEKRALRSRMRGRLCGITDRRRAAAGNALAAALTGHPRWCRLRCMLGFAATRREPDTAPALRAGHVAGQLLGLPRVAGIQLRFHQSAGDLSGLQTGYRGLAEPAADAPPLDLDSLPGATVVLVPGAAFDHSGARLGWGGGYYDRALAEIRRSCGTVLLVGVCFAEQIVGRVPRAAHDEQVDLVVAEKRDPTGPARVTGSRQVTGVRQSWHGWSGPSRRACSLSAGEPPERRRESS